MQLRLLQEPEDQRKHDVLECGFCATALADSVNQAARSTHQNSTDNVRAGDRDSRTSAVVLLFAAANKLFNRARLTSASEEPCEFLALRIDIVLSETALSAQSGKWACSLILRAVNVLNSPHQQVLHRMNRHPTSEKIIN